MDDEGSSEYYNEEISCGSSCSDDESDQEEFGEDDQLDVPTKFLNHRPVYHLNLASNRAPALALLTLTEHNYHYGDEKNLGFEEDINGSVDNQEENF